MRAASTTLVFVYNADGGWLERWVGAAHRRLSPANYPCRLCALTHGAIAMRRPWQEFLAGLHAPVEFLHRDQLQRLAASIRSKELSALPLPAVLLRDGDGPPRPWIGADALRAARTLDELQRLIEARWQQRFPVAG